MKKITFLFSLMMISLGFSQELVTNGDFQTGSAAPWFGNAANVVDLGGGNFVNEANVMTANPGQPFLVNLSQEINLVDGQAYELSFDAYTDATTGTRTIIAGLGQNGGSFAGLTETVTLTDSPQTFTYTFTINYGDGINDRVLFDMAAETGFVFIDNVSVQQAVDLCNDGILNNGEEEVDCGGPNCAPCSSGGNTVTVQVGSSDGYLGYMNVFDNPADTTPNCGGGYCFGSSWVVSDLAAVIGTDNVTLSPNVNTYTDAINVDNAARDYWTNSADGGVTAGADGNKVMEANLFIESNSAFNGNDLTFTGQVASYTLDSRYEAKFFIKALDPNNGFADIFNGTKVVDLPTSGTFSISALGSELASGLIVQYGFSIIGLNANPADDWGSVVVEPVTLSNNEFELSEVKLYPNPTNNNWSIKTNNSTINSIQVFDILGKLVISLSPNSNEAVIDASSLKTGVYMARIEGENGLKTIKLVKN